MHDASDALQTFAPQNGRNVLQYCSDDVGILFERFTLSEYCYQTVTQRCMYVTDNVLYVTDNVLYVTDNRLYVTDNMLYETDNVLYVTDDVL